MSCEELEAVKYIASRLNSLNNSTEYSKSLLEVEEAIYCLDIHDHQEMQAEQKKAFLKLSEQKDFKEDYSKKKQQLRADAAKAGNNKKKRKKDSVTPAALPLHIEQASVKNFLPPNSHCWRGNTR
eukprot:9222047-Lingulodinium_polyedra.AAC.1